MDEKIIPAAIRGDKITEETKILISSLPSYTDSQGRKLCNYEGSWYFYNTLQGVLNFQKGYKPQDTDVILVSFPMSGTTWLKALTVALFERSKNRPAGEQHPLLSNNPHLIVPFLEKQVFHESSSPDIAAKFPSHPRLFSTHIPLHTMHESLKDSSCKVVYICRNVKDVLVSWWYFVSTANRMEAKRGFLGSLFDSFCEGTTFYGPFWENVLSYWKGSLEDPKRVLFMRYEELKAEPHEQIKRLAEFLSCPFTKMEEENGIVEEILDLCSLRNLSGLEVNKTGKDYNGWDNKIYFRKGEVGDSKNYLTPEMESKLDLIVEEKLKVHGFKY